MAVDNTVLATALKQISCPHTNTAGGNDYLFCQECHLEWAYAKRPMPTPVEIAQLALQGRLWNCNVYEVPR